MAAKDEEYQGFEQGPIRPPSEAASLLIRVTRNCPWNRCTFCPVYKGEGFSLRPVDHVIQDIEAVYQEVSRLREAAPGGRGGLTHSDVSRLAGGAGDRAAFFAGVNWLASGMESVFLQDANSLVIKPRDLVAILEHIRRRFPQVARVTSYARSRTVARISDSELSAIRRAGLNRIHIGMESGSDKVLARVCKGVTKADQVKAGQKVKAAGMELSEYVMPGLGGQELSEEHARESADALNQINPDFIRLRSLAIPPSAPLGQEFARGEFKPLKDVEVAAEILLFIESLSGITSRIKSDHILNLFDEVEGRLPEDREAMAQVVRHFLAMDPEKRTVFQVGRRMGLFRTLDDLSDPGRTAQVEEVIRSMSITPENVDDTIYELMRRFI
ncbi:MAG: radical SAM protein [Proteobacteria bacterium]|nr:radical SAM protein [Pseudomonadota bacterium]